MHSLLFAGEWETRGSSPLLKTMGVRNLSEGFIAEEQVRVFGDVIQIHILTGEGESSTVES